jgi:hypothetical protein
MLCKSGKELLNETIDYLNKLGCIKARELAERLQKTTDTPHAVCIIQK